MAALLAAQRDFARSIVACPTFSGQVEGESASVRDFLRKVQVFWLASGLGLEEGIGVQIASVKLIGPAGAWYSGLAVPPADFRSFEAALIARFQPPDAAQVAVAHFIAIAPAKNERDVDRFVQEWQQRISAIPDWVVNQSLELLLLGMFAAKLPGSLQIQLRSTNPANIAMAIPLVLAWSRIAAEPSTNSAMGQRRPVPQLHMLSSGEAPRKAKTSAADEAVKQQRFLKNQCFKCGKEGHRAFACRDIKDASVYIVSGERVKVRDGPVSPHTLLTIRGYIHPHTEPLLVLFDSGASHNFMQLSVANTVGAVSHVQDGSYSTSIRRAGGPPLVNARVKSAQASLKLDNFDHVVDFLIVDDELTGGYQVILGKPWFAARGESLKIDYTTHRMWVGEGSTWVADATVLPSGVVTNNYLEVQEALVSRVMTPVVTTPDSVTATPPLTSLMTLAVVDVGAW